MTQSGEKIVILQEHITTTTPSAGEAGRLVSITYQLPPRPPNVVFINEDLLPDLVWRRENPDAGDVPKDIQEKGDDVRRLEIRQAVFRRQQQPRRTI